MVFEGNWSCLVQLHFQTVVGKKGESLEKSESNQRTLRYDTNIYHCNLIPAIGCTTQRCEFLMQLHLCE